MVTPAPISGSQYYKIGDHVTFGWNYTGLAVTPKAVDVMASCSLNNQLYTIAVNQSFQESQVVVWDTEAEKTNSAPLPMYVPFVSLLPFLLLSLLPTSPLPSQYNLRSTNHRQSISNDE